MPSRHRFRDRREPSPESLIRLAEKADLDDDPKIQNLIQRATATDNTQLKQQVETILAVKAS